MAIENLLKDEAVLNGKLIFMNFPLPCLITEGYPFGNQSRNTMKTGLIRMAIPIMTITPHGFTRSQRCLLSSHWIQKWKVITENFSESWQLGFQFQGLETAAGCNSPTVFDSFLVRSNFIPRLQPPYFGLDLMFAHSCHGCAAVALLFNCPTQANNQPGWYNGDILWLGLHSSMDHVAPLYSAWFRQNDHTFPHTPGGQVQVCLQEKNTMQIGASKDWELKYILLYGNLNMAKGDWPIDWGAPYLHRKPRLWAKGNM